MRASSAPSISASARHRTTTRCASRRDGTDAPRVTLALKEWHAACEAMRCGRQTVLLRKGGIADDARASSFEIRSTKEFALFPTNFHVDAALLAREEAAALAAGAAPDMKNGESVTLALAARVTGAWIIDGARGLEALRALKNYHCWSDALQQTRLAYKPQMGLTILELRAYEAASYDHATLEADLERYGGCKSWIDIDPWTPTTLRACVSDEDFAERGARLRADLEALDATDVLVKCVK